MTNITAPRLTVFQRQFGDYIRKQKHNDGDTVPARVGQLYQNLIFNNVSGFVNQCFPVCRQIVQTHFDKESWEQLLKDFIKNGDMASPYFSEINEQFVAYLTDDVLNRFGLPSFLSELAHYEWIELYVDNLPDGNHFLFLVDNNKKIFINHTAQILHYDWAVQDIGVSFLPHDMAQTFVVVYRKQQGDDAKTAFMNINTLSFIVLTFIQEQARQGVVYHDINELFAQLQATFALDDEIMTNLSISFDDLMATMKHHHVFYE